MAAVIVRTDDPPAVIDAGFAVIVTAVFPAILLPLKSAQPDAKRINGLTLATIIFEMSLDVRSAGKAFSSSS